MYVQGGQRGFLGKSFVKDLNEVKHQLWTSREGKAGGKAPQVCSVDCPGSKVP